MMENEFFKSERLLYRPYCLEDLQTVYAQFNEPSRRRWFYFQEPACLTLEFAKKVIEENQAICSRKVNLLKDNFGLGIVLKENRELIGYIGLTKFHGTDEELEDVEMGWQIAFAYQGSGYATEAVKTAVQWGLTELKQLGVNAKIAAKIEHENWASRRVAEKAGLTFVRAETYVSVYEVYE